MKKLLLFLLLLQTVFVSYSQDTLLNKYLKPNNSYGTILNRVYTPFALTPALDTLPEAPQGSIAFKDHVMFFKDTTWKIWTGSSGSISYVNGWGLGLSGNSFRVDTSLVPTIWYADNRFYTKSQINAFFSGVTPISGYNKANWDAVYSAYAAAQALSPAGWATQHALVDTAAALRAIIAGAGTGDMMKSVYDANNNGIVDILELTGILIGNNTSNPTAIAGTANQLLRRNAANTAYEFFTPSYLTGNQTISFSPTGDVTGSTTGTTTLAPALTIGNGKVTNAMLAGSIAISKLSITGTPDGTKYLRDDGSWQTVSGGGGSSLTQVADISALQAYSGSESFLYVKDVKRGGFFEYTTSSLTDDNGIIFAATGKGSGHWKRRFDKAVGLNIEWYGAIGDGVTDNSSVIQGTINAADAGGYKVYIPNGTFLSNGFTTGNTATTRVNDIYGNGDSSRLKITSDTSIITITSHSIHIHDLSFVGNGTGLHQRAIRIPGWAYNTIDHCNFQTFGRSAVYIDQQSSTAGNMVSNNRFEGNSIGVETGTSGQYNSISSNTFYANDTAIYSFGTNNIIDGNNISGNPSGNVGDGIVIKGDPSTNNGKHIVSNNNINHVTNAIQVLDCSSFGNTIKLNHILVTSVALYVKNSINVNFDGNRVGGVTPYIRWEGSTGTFIGNQFYADLPQMDFAYNSSPSTVFRALTTTVGGVTTTASVMNYESDLSSSYTDRSMIDRAYGDTRWIQNQNSSSQTANARISGTIRADGGALFGGATALNGFDAVTVGGNGLEVLGRLRQLAGDNTINGTSGKTVIGTTAATPDIKFIVTNTTHPQTAQFDNALKIYPDSLDIGKLVKFSTAPATYSSGGRKMLVYNSASTRLEMEDVPTGGGGGSGTVNSGTANQIAYYATSGTAVGGASGITTDGSKLNISGKLFTNGETTDNGFDGNYLGGNGTVNNGRFRNLHYTNYFNEIDGITSIGYAASTSLPSVKFIVANTSSETYVAQLINSSGATIALFNNDSIELNKKVVFKQPAGYPTIRLYPINSEPTTTNPGDVWYNSVLGKYRANENGTVKDLINISSMSPAGNYGNVQINRNGVFSTAASDSLNWDATNNRLNVIGSLRSTVGVYSAIGNFSSGVYSGDFVQMSEVTSITTPSAGRGNLYAKNDGKVYYKNSAGTDYDLTIGSTGLPDPGSNGIVVRTASNTTVARSFADGVGIGWNSANGVSANPQPYVKGWQEWTDVTAQTTTNSTITVATYSCPNDATGTMVIEMIATKDDNSKSLSGRKTVHWHSTAGAVTVDEIVTDNTDYLRGFTTATWTVDASGGTLRIRASGESATNIDWHPMLKVKYNSYAL